MTQMYNDEQNNPYTLSIPQLLHNSDAVVMPKAPLITINTPGLTETSYQSPDSSTNTSNQDPSGAPSSFTPSIPASSESLVGLQIPIVAAVDVVSDSSTDNVDFEFRPPDDPKLHNEYKQIISRPGPKSLKRKRIEDLVNISSQQQNARNTPPAAEVADHFLNILAKRAPNQKRRKDRSANLSQSSSLSDSSTSQRNDISNRNDVIQPPPTSLLLSPVSSQTVLQSPSVSLVTRRRRPSSSSLSSDEQLLPGLMAPSRNKVPNASKPPQPSTVVRSRPRVDDGNAHSNSGAPRRIGVNIPPSGPSGRDSRALAKMVSGG